MPKKSKLEIHREDAIKYLNWRRSNIDPRTRSALENKLYRAPTINKLDKILEKLKAVPSKATKATLLKRKQNHKDEQAKIDNERLAIMNAGEAFHNDRLQSSIVRRRDKI